MTHLYSVAEVRISVPLPRLSSKPGSQSIKGNEADAREHPITPPTAMAGGEIEASSAISGPSAETLAEGEDLSGLAPEDAAALVRALTPILPIPVAAIVKLRITRESIDARKKPQIFRVLQLEFETHTALSDPLPAGIRKLDSSRLQVLRPETLIQITARGQVRTEQEPVIVVGAGPAGLFAALALGEAGQPTLLLERGKPVETRMRDIGQLRSHGLLDPESNVCFGEGGAGTYTDGKLYTRIKHPFVRWVYQRFVEFGGPARILAQSHPHLGTDKLVRIVKRMREHLISLGVSVRFETRVDSLWLQNGQVRGVRLASGEEIPASAVVLAIGHSARDTLDRLWRDGIELEAKPFAVGVRAEHPQDLINQAQFGDTRLANILGAAAYQLTHQVPDAQLGKRGVYSFCMCPGGFIVPSPTEPGHTAINGMSNANRSAPYANSGIVVQISPDDLVRHGLEELPLRGIAFQRELERSAFLATALPYAAPAMRIDDFVARRPSGKLASTNFRPAAEAVDLWKILPRWVASPLREGVMAFDRKLHGFLSAEGNLLGVESRTSSPVRIPRASSLQARSHPGLYPIGEGAGYAGGIVSAAVDGLRAAEAILAARGLVILPAGQGNLEESED